MKKIIILTSIFFLVFVATGCLQKTNETEKIFESLTSQTYPQNMTLEEGYKIIAPYVKQWDEGAILTKYSTNILNDKINFESHLYSFVSHDKTKGLAVVFNRTIPETLESVGDPNFFILTNSFDYKEVDYSKEDWKSMTQEEITDWEDSIERFKINLNENFLNSSQAILLSNQQGLTDFVFRYNSLGVMDCAASFTLLSGQSEWHVSCMVVEPETSKISHSLYIIINAENGTVKSKNIK